MHYLLNNLRLVVPWFALGLGIACVLAATLLSRKKRTPPFRNYFCSDYGRSLFPDDALSASEDVLADEHSTFSDFSSRYRGSSGWRARAQGERE